MFEPEQQKKISPMYDPKFEHDACGIGAVINIQGVKTYDTVDRALKIVENWSIAPARMPPARWAMA